MEYSTIISISLFLVFLRLLYSYLKQPYVYWKEQGVPFDTGVPFLGSFLDVIRSTFHDAQVKMYKKYGRIYGYFEGFQPVLCVAEPDLLKDVYVKDFQFFTGGRKFNSGDPTVDKMIFNLRGEDWKRVRTIITPAFSTGKIRKMFSIIEDSAATLCRNLSRVSKNGKAVDAKRLYGTFSMDVIASCAFGTKVDSHNDPDNPFVSAARKVFTGEIWRFVIVFLFPKMGELLHISPMHPGGTDFLRKATLKIVAERRRTEKKYNDLLQVMVDAVEEAKKGKLLEAMDDDDVEDESVKDMGHEEGNENVFKLSSLKNKGMDYDELVANCVMFFFVGYESTGSTLSFITYNLALNPRCQEKVIEEIDESIRQNQGKLTYEAVQNMKYLNMVIAETLRLYPIAVRSDRVADADYKLGDTGIMIKKGDIVSVPIYAMHHDPENFADPEKFDPMRFTPEEKAKRNSYNYLPFGGGPRNCLGMRFALNEIKICLAYIMSRFRFKRCPETKVPLEFRGAAGILQAKQILLRIEERTDKVIES